VLVADLTLWCTDCPTHHRLVAPPPQILTGQVRLIRPASHQPHAPRIPTHTQPYGELCYESSTSLFYLTVVLKCTLCDSLVYSFVLFVPLQTFEMFAVLPKVFVIGSRF